MLTFKEKRHSAQRATVPPAPVNGTQARTRTNRQVNSSPLCSKVNAPHEKWCTDEPRVAVHPGILPPACEIARGNGESSEKDGAVAYKERPTLWQGVPIGRSPVMEPLMFRGRGSPP